MKSQHVTIQMKATEQYFPVVVFIVLYKVVLSFESAAEILECDHSNESYLAVFSCGAVCYAVLFPPSGEKWRENGKESKNGEIKKSGACRGRSLIPSSCALYFSSPHSPAYWKDFLQRREDAVKDGSKI